MKHATRLCSKHLAHELLNQLNVIVGNCELLSETIIEDERIRKLPDPNCERYLRRISEAASVMTSKVKSAITGKDLKV